MLERRRPVEDKMDVTSFGRLLIRGEVSNLSAGFVRFFGLLVVKIFPDAVKKSTTQCF
jgi:hypothetical protein